MEGIPSIENGEANVPETPPRATTQERWKSSELHLLISLKRQEQELSLGDQSRERFRTADLKWTEIQTGLAQKNVTRSKAQIQKRWEKMVTNFKRIFDYQRHIPSGEKGYFEMGSEERKKKKLPPHFLHEYFNALDSWFPSHRVVHPSPDQVVDSSAEGSSNHANTEPMEQGSQETPSQGTRPTPMERQAPPEAAPASSRRSTNGHNANCNSADPPESTDYQRRKRNKSARLDEHFGKSTSMFIDAIATQVENLALHEKELLEWDKEKTEANLAMQKEIGSEISGSLRDVSASFRFFATEMAKRGK